MASAIANKTTAAEATVLNDKRKYENNVIVMSKAGKPIFCRYGDESDMVKTCAMIAAIRSSLVDNDMFGLGDFDSMRSEELTIVFMSVGSITLIATSARGEDGEYATEVYLRLLLEYVYSQIIFTLTEQIQTVLEDNPSLDLGTMLGSTDTVLLDILNEAGPFGNCSTFFTSGVATIFPIQSKIREDASQAVYKVGNATPNTVFAILLVDDKLLTLVQPHYRPHQMQTSDLHLIVNFVKHQPGLFKSDLWVPMCLPRFNSTGFLHAYSTCLDEDTKLSLVLLSQHSTTQQFELFRRAAGNIRKELGLPTTPGSVLRILDNEDPINQGSDVTGDDIAWRRSDVGIEEQSSDEDYVNVTAELGLQSMGAEDASNQVCPLLRELQRACRASFREELLEEYCTISSAIHFCFRIDVPLRKDHHKPRRKHTTTTGTTLNQVISPPLDFPFVTPASKRHVWNVYHKMNLRLRLGSSTPDTSMEALDTILEDRGSADQGNDMQSSIDDQCPALCMAASLPEVDGITYVKDGGELFIGLSGENFELYMALPSAIPVHEGTALGAKLIRTIRAEENELFLMKPLTW